MRQEYINFNPETFRVQKLKSKEAELKYLDEQVEKQKKQFQYNEAFTSKRATLSEAIVGGLIIGLPVGLCLCLVTGMFVKTGVIPLTCLFGTPIIMMPIVYKSRYINNAKKRQLDQGAQNVEEQKNAAARKIYEEVERDCREFNEGFEQEVCAKALSFPQPPVEQSYARKAAGEFLDKIRSAGSDKSVRTIDVSFAVKVYADKVTTPLSDYAVMSSLLRPLEGFAEKTAMARSVASAVQIELMTMLDGEIYHIDRKEGYELDAAVAYLNYKADNKHFEELRGW